MFLTFGAMYHSSSGRLVGNPRRTPVPQSTPEPAPSSGSRLHDGRHEVDLIVERPDGAVVAAEVKLGGVVVPAALLGA